MRSFPCCEFLDLIVASTLPTITSYDHICIASCSTLRSPCILDKPSKGSMMHTTLLPALSLSVLAAAESVKYALQLY